MDWLDPLDNKSLMTRFEAFYDYNLIKIIITITILIMLFINKIIINIVSDLTLVTRLLKVSTHFERQ